MLRKAIEIIKKNSISVGVTIFVGGGAYTLHRVMDTASGLNHVSAQVVDLRVEVQEAETDRVRDKLEAELKSAEHQIEDLKEQLKRCGQWANYCSKQK